MKFEAASNQRIMVLRSSYPFHFYSSLFVLSALGGLVACESNFDPSILPPGHEEDNSTPNHAESANSTSSSPSEEENSGETKATDNGGESPVDDSKSSTTPWEKIVVDDPTASWHLNTQEYQILRFYPGPTGASFAIATRYLPEVGAEIIKISPEGETTVLPSRQDNRSPQALIPQKNGDILVFSAKENDNEFANRDPVIEVQSPDGKVRWSTNIPMPCEDLGLMQQTVREKMMDFASQSHENPWFYRGISGKNQDGTWIECTQAHQLDIQSGEILDTWTWKNSTPNTIGRVVIDRYNQALILSTEELSGSDRSLYKLSAWSDENSMVWSIPFHNPYSPLSEIDPAEGPMPDVGYLEHFAVDDQVFVWITSDPSDDMSYELWRIDADGKPISKTPIGRALGQEGPEYSTVSFNGGDLRVYTAAQQENKPEIRVFDESGTMVEQHQLVPYLSPPLSEQGGHELEIDTIGIDHQGRLLVASTEHRWDDLANGDEEDLLFRRLGIHSLCKE